MFSTFEPSSRILKMMGQCRRCLTIRGESLARAPPRGKGGAQWRLLDAREWLDRFCRLCRSCRSDGTAGNRRPATPQAERGSRSREKKLAESGSMIWTAHRFLPSLAEIRLGWSLAVPRTRSVRAAWCFPLREAIRPDRSGRWSHDTFLTISDHISNFVIPLE